MKSLGKTRRKYVWCNEKSLDIEEINFTTKDPPKKKVRCPDCNKLLFVKWVNCHAGWPAEPCWHPKYPAHKKWIKK